MLHFSIASAWEIAIKGGLGKISGVGDAAAFVRTRLQRQQIVTLGISLDHVLGVANLPPHHRDPFDRLLVAQAQVESLTIITADRKIGRYDVAVHDARS